MSCFKNLFKKRGSSVPAIPTGNVVKQDKKAVKKASSLKNVSSKKSTVNTTSKSVTLDSGMGVLNPEVIDSDDEIESKQKSTTSKRQISARNEREGIPPPVLNQERSKSMLEYDTSSESSTLPSKLFEETRTKNNQIANEASEVEVTKQLTQKSKMNATLDTSNNLEEFYPTMDQHTTSEKKISFSKDVIVQPHSELSSIRDDHIKSQSNKENLISDKIYKLSSSMQREENDILINEQSQIIEALRQHCRELEEEILNRKPFGEENSENQLKPLKEEIFSLRDMVRRLNSELSSLRWRSPVVTKQIKEEPTRMPVEGPVPSWQINTKFLSPLIAAYDDRLAEKEDKNKQLKRKIDELFDKLKILADENLSLQKKISLIPQNLIKQYLNEENKLNEWEQIKRHSQLVLEENIVLHEQLDLQSQKFNEFQNNFNQEKARLSKRLLFLESEKTDLVNEMDILKLKNDELQRKYNEILVENERRIDVQTHLNQINELKKNVEQVELNNQNEMEKTVKLLQTVQAEKAQLSIRLNDAILENKQLVAEIEVLDKNIQEGIGRKVQRKLTSLQKQVELSKIKEKTAYVCLSKITKEVEKKNLEAETLKSMTKTHEFENIKIEKKTSEQTLKIAKLEQQLESLKKKASLKLAKNMERLQQKDVDYSLLKLENEKKISDILNLLQKKQDQIDQYINEKKTIEEELNVVWRMATNDHINSDF